MVGLIKGCWNMWLDDYGVAAWQGFFANQDFDLSMAAYRTLSERQPARPTIADFRQLISKLEVDRRMSQPQLEQPVFKRHVPEETVKWISDRFPGILKEL